MIPAEIVDHILSILHSDQDYTTLETCSFIFPLLVDLHLYSRITLCKLFDLPKSWAEDIHKSAKGTYIIDPTKFSLILIDRPHIANYVRLVRVILIKKGVAQPPFVENRLLILPVIASILSNLSQIESITLDATPHDTPWSILVPEFHTAFRNSLRLPSIRAVAISNVCGPFLDTFDCKNLSFLRVDSRLELTSIVAWMDSNTLHTLSLRIHGDVISKFRTLIEACSSTLVNLQFRYMHVSTLEQRHYVLPRLPLLEHLIVRAPGMFIVRNRTLFFSLPQLAPFFISNPSLSDIRLTLHIRFTNPSNPFKVKPFDASAIADFLGLPVFRRPIALYISPKGCDQGTLDRFVSAFRQNSDMKRLTDGKVIVIMISDEDRYDGYDA